MFKYYKCEYCGRKILTSICPYCNGINDLEHMKPIRAKKSDKDLPDPAEMDREIPDGSIYEKALADNTTFEEALSEKTASVKERSDETASEKERSDETASKKSRSDKTASNKSRSDKTAFKKSRSDKTASEKGCSDETASGKNRVKKTRTVPSVSSRKKKKEKKKIQYRPKIDKTSLLIFSVVLLAALLFYILHDADIVWDSKKNKKTDNVIECSQSVEISYTHSNVVHTVTLPCRFSEISDKFKIINPVIPYPDKNDPDGDGIYDLEPHNSCYASDSYGLLRYSVTNDSDEKAPYTIGYCDKLTSTDHFRNCTSLKFDGTELITDIDSLIDIWGEPSKTEYGAVSTTYTYNTTHGHIILIYYEKKDKNRPNDIEICMNK